MLCDTLVPVMLVWCRSKAQVGGPGWWPVREPVVKESVVEVSVAPAPKRCTANRIDRQLPRVKRHARCPLYGRMARPCKRVQGFGYTVPASVSGNSPGHGDVSVGFRSVASASQMVLYFVRNRAKATHRPSNVSHRMGQKCEKQTPPEHTPLGVLACLDRHVAQCCVFYGRARFGLRGGSP